MSHFPEQRNDGDGVKRILTLDWLSRLSASWPLVPFDHIEPLYHSSLPDPLNPLPSTYSRKPTKTPKSTLLIRELYDNFPPLEPMILRHQGKIAVCGGILCRLVMGKRTTEYADCDVFFYGRESGEVSREVLGEYRDVLEDCVGMIAERASGPVVVDRNENVVTVVDRAEGSVYQFILRIYPRLDSIIGGFDLGPCMIAFDGLGVYTTPLGAWSYAKRAIIVDTTRRSVSYEHRLMKYRSLGFSVVLPGLDRETVRKERSEKMTFGEITKKLHEVGLRYMGEDAEDLFVVDDFVKIVVLNGRIRVEEDGLSVSLLSMKPRLCKKDKELSENQERYSDYGHFEPAIHFSDGVAYKEMESKYYASLLKNGKKERFFVCSSVPNHYEGARRAFADMIDHPKVQFCDNFIQKHNMWLKHVPVVVEGRLNNSIFDCRLFAEYYAQYQELVESFSHGMGRERRMEREKMIASEQYCLFMEKVSKELNLRIMERAENWIKDLKGLKWRTQNPGTQHTASINPIMEDPRKFYVDCYRPFTIGIPPEVETCIRVILKLRLGFPADIVKLIMRLVVERTHSYFPVVEKKKRKYDSISTDT